MKIHYNIIILSAIAIDLMKGIVSENELKRNWDKVPKNQSYSKFKIIKSLILMRNKVEMDGYKLDQLFHIGITGM